MLNTRMLQFVILVGVASNAENGRL